MASSRSLHTVHLAAFGAGNVVGLGVMSMAGIGVGITGTGLWLAALVGGLGGAFALALASDLVCASDRALFVPAFCQIGIMPEMGMCKFLPELVGAQRAKELLFFGGKIPAQRLCDWGLVNRVFPASALEEETLSFARELAAMPDASIQITKGLVNALADDNLETCLQAESTASPFCTTTRAYAAAMERFAR